METTVFEMQARLCKAMSHATRLEIVHSLRDGPKSVGDLVLATGLSHANISRHLSALRNSSVVTSQRQGQEIICYITNPKITAVCDLMRQVVSEQAAHQYEIAEALNVVTF
jgi:DNA-binding transcriptional ArsR family regulator